VTQLKVELKDIEELATRFAADHLDSYIQQVSSQGRTFYRKEINDALWGTIGLTPAEVILLDSPLLQRLRYVRQLGVVHWVYPGAVHTRFEHTLGVMFQVQHLMVALNAQAATALPPSGPLIDASMMQLMRLCALLHDAGHAAFSHVSEMAVESLPEVNPISATFSAQLRVEKRQLSEIFAFYVVRSKAMRGLLELLLDRCGLNIALDSDRSRNLDFIVERVSDAIIGKKIDDRLPLLHELISGPFDADKLDYFVRDAKLAGTPSLVDISRLVQKLTIKYLDASELPKDIGSNVRQLDSKYCLFGMKWSGVAVLDELLLARVLLFAKIYRHPKVSAIEQMLRAVILTLARVAPAGEVIKFLYYHADDALLNMNSSALAAALGLDSGLMDAEAKVRVEYAAETLKAVRDRRLWVRGFQIQRRYPADPLEGNREHSEALIAFLEDVEHPQKRLAFIESLLNELNVVLGILSGGAAPSRTQLESLVMIHTLGPTPGGTQISRAYLLPTSGSPMPFREYTVNRTAWADSYLSDQPKGFIFSPPDLADGVFLAVEKLIRRDYNVKLPSSALEVSKRDSGRIDAAKRILVTHGYYAGVAFDIRPIPERLQRADVQPAIQRFDHFRAAYQEPQPKDVNEQVNIIDSERTRMWLRQFSDDSHVDCALRLLDKFRMLSRKDTVTALRSFIDGNPDFRGAWVVPFGSAKDSGSVQTYFSADLQGSYVAGCSTLEDVARLGGQTPVIFIDDFVGSGGQAKDILAAGFNALDMRNDALDEQRSIFDDTVQRHLRMVKVGFVFTAAWDAGIEKVKEITQQLKLQATVFRLLDETQIPFAFELLEGVDPRTIASFRAHCVEIGNALLESQSAAQTSPLDQAAASKRAERVLGYGNRAMLLASPFNVPTQSLTAIWAQGKVNGVEWVPLLTRRKKL